jgi:hypothetical protein
MKIKINIDDIDCKKKKKEEEEKRRKKRQERKKESACSLISPAMPKDITHITNNISRHQRVNCRRLNWTLGFSE